MVGVKKKTPRPHWVVMDEGLPEKLDVGNSRNSNPFTLSWIAGFVPILLFPQMENKGFLSRIS